MVFSSVKGRPIIERSSCTWLRRLPLARSVWGLRRLFASRVVRYIQWRAD
jgi:hypothetical protein